MNRAWRNSEKILHGMMVTAAAAVLLLSVGVGCIGKYYYNNNIELAEQEYRLAEAESSPYNN